MINFMSQLVWAKMPRYLAKVILDVSVKMFFG